jgi:hypothetical protein
MQVKATLAVKIGEIIKHRHLARPPVAPAWFSPDKWRQASILALDQTLALAVAYRCPEWHSP